MTCGDIPTIPQVVPLNLCVGGLIAHPGEGADVSAASAIRRRRWGRWRCRSTPGGCVRSDVQGDPGGPKSRLTDRIRSVPQAQRWGRTKSPCPRARTVSVASTPDAAATAGTAVTSRRRAVTAARVSAEAIIRLELRGRRPVAHRSDHAERPVTESGSIVFGVELRCFDVRVKSKFAVAKVGGRKFGCG